jgi:hypothetical protein
MGFIQGPQDWLKIGLGTVAAVLVYDYIMAPRIRRRITKQVRDDVRSSLGASSGAKAGAAFPSAPPDAVVTPAAPADPSAPASDPAGTSPDVPAVPYRLDEYVKSLRDQQRKMDEDRKGMLEERSRLDAMRREIETGQEAVRIQARDVSEARMTLEARRAALEAEALVSGSGAAAARAERTGTSPAVQWTALEAQTRELEAEKQKLAREYADIEARRSALDQRERALAQQREEMERERSALLEMRKQLASRQETIEQTQKRYAQLLVALERERIEASRPPEGVRAAMERLRREGEAALAAPSEGAPAPATAVGQALACLRLFYGAFPPEAPRLRVDAFLARLSVDEKLVTDAQVRECRDLQAIMEPPAPPLGFLLLRMGYLDEAKLRRILELHPHRLPAAAPAAAPASEPAVEALPPGPVAVPSPPDLSPVDSVAGAADAAMAPHLKTPAPPEPGSDGSTGRSDS